MPRSNNEKAGVCVRERGNWGSLKPVHKFDNKSFDKEQFLKDLPAASPKLAKLLSNIKELDAKDMAKHKHKFKHFIYSDMKSVYGTKLIAAGLLASGYEHAYSHTGSFSLLPFPSASDSAKGNRFATLTSTSMFDKPIGVNFRRQLFKAFNARPDNVFGDNIRIVLLDSGFREGVDLFDVKYVHLFEPIITASDQKQAIGRATRYCGQKGLKFDRARGWPLHVYRYETTIPKHVQASITANIPHLSPTSFFETFMYYSNIDPRKMQFANELISMALEGAMDKQYTAAIHSATPAAASATIGGDESAKYKWPKMKMENMCNAPMASSLKLTPTQEFIKDTFTPKYDKHGMLLVHSVGTGKTCTAIAMASSSFEAEDYTIIYVTRYTLKADVWKNMFEQVCSVVVKDYLDSGKPLPDNHAARMRIISKKWLDPVSYKQFSNMISNKSQMYDTLVKTNGQQDVLRKTLVIIDEAHKLFADDVEGQEKADVDAIRKAFTNSYEKSGNDSVKVVFMTATPYTSEPMDMIRLLNLLRPKSEAIPDTFEDFSKEYLDESGSFSATGKKAFIKELDGYISYLNREKDMRSFAYPVMHEVRVPMSEYEFKDAIKTYRVAMEQMHEAKADYDDAKENENDGVVDEKKEGMVKIQNAYNVQMEEYKKCMADTKAQATGDSKGRVDHIYKDLKAMCNSSKKKCLEENGVQLATASKEARAVNKGDKEALHQSLERLKATSDAGKVQCQANFSKCNEMATGEKTTRMKQVQDFKGARKGECKTLKERAEGNKKMNTHELNDLIKKTKQIRKEHVEQLQAKYKEAAASDKKAKIDLKTISESDLSQLTGIEQCFAKSNSKYRTLATSMMNLDDSSPSSRQRSLTPTSSTAHSSQSQAPITKFTLSASSSSSTSPLRLTAPPDISIPEKLSSKTISEGDIEIHIDSDEEDDTDDGKAKKAKVKSKGVPKATLKKLQEAIASVSGPLFGARRVIPDKWTQYKARLLFRLVSAQHARAKSRVLSHITKTIRLMDYVIENMDSAPEKLMVEEPDLDTSADDGLIRIKKHSVYVFEKQKYNLHSTVHGVIPVEVQSNKYKKCASKALAAKIVKLYNRKKGSRLVDLPKTSTEWMADSKTFDNVCKAARAWS